MRSNAASFTFKNRAKADQSQAWEWIQNSQLGNPNEVAEFVPMAMQVHQQEHHDLQYYYDQHHLENEKRHQEQQHADTSAGHAVSYSLHEMLRVRQLLASPPPGMEPVYISALPMDEIKSRQKYAPKIAAQPPPPLQIPTPEVPEQDGMTLMLKNIPNKYTRQQLVQELWRQVGQTFDFVYLPIDFSTMCNVGYCFVNFRSMEGADDFKAKFHNVHTRDCLPGFNSNKVCLVTKATVQGSKANMAKLAPSMIPLLYENPDWQPVCFDASGNEYRDCAFLPPPTPPPISSMEQIEMDVVPPPPGGSCDEREVVSLSDALPLIEANAVVENVGFKAKESLIRSQVECYMANCGSNEVAVEKIAEDIFGFQAGHIHVDIVFAMQDSKQFQVSHTIHGSIIRKRDADLASGAEL